MTAAVRPPNRSPRRLLALIRLNTAVAAGIKNVGLARNLKRLTKEIDQRGVFLHQPLHLTGVIAAAGERRAHHLQKAQLRFALACGTDRIARG